MQPMPHQELFTWTNWPLLVVCLGMIAAAVIDWWKFKVPNRLTFPLILSGWLFGLLNNFGLLPAAYAGGLGGALLGTALGLGLLLPIYALGGMGAGDLQIALGVGPRIRASYQAPPVPWPIL